MRVRCHRDLAWVCQQPDLDAEKLLAILQGWEPSSVKLPWLTKIETDDGGMAVNAYLIKIHKAKRPCWWIRAGRIQP